MGIEFYLLGGSSVFEGDNMTKDEALKLALDLAIMHHSDDGYAELRSKVRQFAKEALAEQSAQQEPVAWVCNECGAHEFTSAISEEDLKDLACASCGCDEFHKEALAQQDAFKAAYIEAMIASNEAGFAGMTAAETIRELARMVSEQPAQQEPATKDVVIANMGKPFTVKAYVTPQPAQQDSTCSNALRDQGKAYPRTCKKCGLGPCIADQVQPAQQEPVAWRWSESGGVRWFDWTTDWSHYDRAKAMGFPIQYAAPQPAQRTWVGLTDEERQEIWKSCDPTHAGYVTALVEAKLKEKNT